MSWAALRETTRLEDSAYCLIGLFNVNIPLLYGEGSKAFWRLEQEIIKQTDDETIFAWTGVEEGGSGLLAPSPANFLYSGSIQQDKQHGERPPYQTTNRGLSIECQMLPCEMNTYVVPLRCQQGRDSLNSRQVVIFLCRTSEDQQYRRVSFQDKCIDEATGWDISKAKTESIFVPDEGRTLELSPHAGLPLVRVESNLEAWLFPRIGPGAHGSSWVDSPADLEGGGIQLEENQSWMPKKVTEVSFQSRCRDLEKGVVIALKRPAADENHFRYYLEIGFDIDFTPVCILHIRQFELLLGPSSRGEKIWGKKETGFLYYDKRTKLRNLGISARPRLAGCQREQNHWT
ncbi:hypothetical protein GJ744_007759 [Endocarpon pusillum]|uniref:Uncharacterized protein n=1 Tax=Endocarpon pusillum TaxID=364733 RepID=A0A8H7AR48_9EURO|nr:hypothetical protein GJ744_007759 [Endocarpon pusillum]